MDDTAAVPTPGYNRVFDYEPGLVATEGELEDDGLPFARNDEPSGDGRPSQNP